MEDEIGWLWIHGTSAGCASIVCWEGLASIMSGPILMVTFGAITFVSLHMVARHHRKAALVQARRRIKTFHTRGGRHVHRRR